ncbi:hypothetical protein JYQ62_09725 [Nostoc sp. UHCC 0702]|nr:hypothetical protein JYQ62_26510 [Nostoc sp. UHCC 0702]QSJ17000.1 hypothetical protein JYQ62_35985 [Nostoc sp. UHCC 0702]QSJ17892.1 hypothetical protein JYQ62_03250 [Nostoc sp. UHCC 0702]QSJ17942.1 hypothetical protein JYQ62_03520 [Nostoc sp. UHCC 0702]QSJ18418.1 hypothetical protein JYQ62_06470 [Nostoc sp. UHCC 0702]
MLAGKSPIKSYKNNDVKESESVKIRGKWLYAVRNQGEALNLLGKYSVHELGWGSSYYDCDSFTAQEKALLKQTIK